MYFVGTRADLEPGIGIFEAELPLKYVAMGFHSNSNIEVFSSALSIPEFGRLICLTYQFGSRRIGAGDYMSSQKYLVCVSGEEIQAEPVPQMEGGVLYDLISEQNPHAFIFTPGGVDQRGDLFGGACGIWPAMNATATDLSKQYFETVTRGFQTARGHKRTGGQQRYRVGPEAMAMLKSGANLKTVEAMPILLPEKKR